MILGETRKQVIVVTGTKQEAKVLARADVEVLIAGNDQAALAQQLAEVAPRAAGFVSFGMAGAIDRTLRLGQWLIARRVSGPHAAMADEAWVEALKTCLPGARLGSIYADGRLFATQQDKVEQSATSAAMAVDMESHLVAQSRKRPACPCGAALHFRSGRGGAAARGGGDDQRARQCGRAGDAEIAGRPTGADAASGAHAARFRPRLSRTAPWRSSAQGWPSTRARRSGTPARIREGPGRDRPGSCHRAALIRLQTRMAAL
jgi:hypothetical protein